jgi:hypothetical protein
MTVESSPLRKWLKRDWPVQERLVADLPFIDRVDLSKIGPNFASIFVKIRVDLPQNGPVCDIKEIEQVFFVLGPDFPNEKPEVLLRHNFPPVPHLGSRKDKFRIMCLTRRDPREWWAGRLFVDIVKSAYDWLCDAAAGKLVKDDDPFEPLIARGTVPVILNIPRARSECEKHAGIWSTQSVLRKLPNNGNLLIVGEGTDVQTVLWYQPEPQNELWLDRPETIEELLDMAYKVGVSRESIIYRIEKGTHVLFIFGIKRPKEVLGSGIPEEWVAFELTRHKEKAKAPWKIETHLVYQDFNSQIAAITSGFTPTENKVVVIGGGALGSEVCESLARSGTVRLVLIDDDRLFPHNLARHTLGRLEIGALKADALSAKLNHLLKNEICVPYCYDLTALPGDIWRAIIQDAHCIIDCSASIAVQQRLSELDCGTIPVFSCYQIDGGHGTVLLFSPDLSKTSLGLLEACLVTRLRGSQAVSNWLTRDTETVSIGGGCRSISSKISSSLVKMGAGWISDKILNCLNSKKMPTSAFYKMLENYSGPEVIRLHNTEVAGAEIITGDWKIIVSDTVSGQTNTYAKSAEPNETGGVLIGRIDKQRKIAYITEAWNAPKGSSSTRNGFSRGLAGLKNEIAMLEKDTGDFLGYVGEWHSHPKEYSAELSSIDSPTAKRMAQELEDDCIPAVCLITNGQSWKTHVVEVSDPEHEKTE